MKYQIGDEILVLHTNEEGKVVEIINEKIVLIEVKGVKFPAYMDQIDFPYFYRFTKKKLVAEDKPKPKIYVDQIPKEKPQPNAFKTEEGVSISLMPKFSYDDFDDEIVEQLKVYLVNKTDKTLSFKYDYDAYNENRFLLSNTIYPFQDFYLHDIAFDDLSNNPVIQCNFSLPQPEKLLAENADYSLKLKAKQMFDKIEKLKQNNQTIINFPLFLQYPSRQEIAATKLSIKQQKTADYKPLQARSVVDLHIEKISDSWKSLTSFEILQLQLAEFEKWYAASVIHYQKQLIIIHGVGVGRLRDELHSILKLKPEVDYFVNQYHPSYGYGATEIYFK